MRLGRPPCKPPAPLLVAKPSHGLGAQGALVSGMILMPLGWFWHRFRCSNPPRAMRAHRGGSSSALSPLSRHREMPFAWRRSPKAAWAAGRSVSRASAEAPSWCHEVSRFLPENLLWDNDLEHAEVLYLSCSRHPIGSRHDPTLISM